VKQLEQERQFHMHKLENGWGHTVLVEMGKYKKMKKRALLTISNYLKAQDLLVGHPVRQGGRGQGAGGRRKIQTKT